MRDFKRVYNSEINKLKEDRNKLTEEVKSLKEDRDKLNQIVKEKSSSQKEIEKKKQELKEKFDP